jgi:hypothetical protein
MTKFEFCKKLIENNGSCTEPVWIFCSDCPFEVDCEKETKDTRLEKAKEYIKNNANEFEKIYSKAEEEIKIEDKHSEPVLITEVIHDIDRFNKGSKEKINKIPLSLLSIPAILKIAKILLFGTKKYDKRNWEKGLNWSDCFEAALRHLWKWYLREELDEESGENHIHHAACEIMFLQHFVETKTGTDDRPDYKNIDLKNLFKGE